MATGPGAPITDCGADNWVGIELFGGSKEEWLAKCYQNRTFLELPNGIP